MKRMNVAWMIMAVLASIFLIVVLLLTAIDLVSYDIGFYRRQYNLLNRPQEIGISEQELVRVTQEMLDYLAGRREALDIRATIMGVERYVFNQREIAHMVDVRGLFAMANLTRNILAIAFVSIIALLYAVLGRKLYRYLGNAYILTVLSVAVALGLLTAAIARDFTAYWIKFHLIFFDNDLWLLDPRTDVLIQMVPEQFFYNTVMTIIIYFGIGIGAAALLSVWALVSSRREKHPKQA